MSADIAADVLPAGIMAQIRAARSAQPWWADISIAERAAVIGETARRLAADAPALASVIAAASERPLAEAWAAEIVPTLDALRWLARRGASCLASRRLPRSGLQWYFRATRHRLDWEPHGLGPILAVAAFDSEEQAVAWINDREHRLSASLCAPPISSSRT